ncbi:MAG: GNAT family N-acetyltransferase [Desulfopila sp.]
MNDTRHPSTPPRPLTVRWHDSIDQIDQRQWDRLALPLSTPLFEYRWLHHLEASGSITSRHGWQPNHLTAWSGQDLVGAVPLYLKNDSWGEFVFDHWWVRLAEKYQIRYYPKLVGMSPVTPSVGFRFLVAEHLDQRQVCLQLLAAIDRFCQENEIPGCQLNFVDTAWFAALDISGFIGWQHQSYLWENRGFNNFDDYLQTFKSSQRRNIRREQRSMERQGIVIRALTGEEIPTTFGELMYRQYLNTNTRYGPWAARYLNAQFFRRIFSDFRHRLLLFAAYLNGSVNPIALSMLLVKDGHLIGRYWGCDSPTKDLHFNMCYYQPINWAIANGIRTFDPGAGSPHKIMRGFAPVANTSLHRLYTPHLQALFAQLIDQVNTMEQAHIDELNEMLPLANRR